MSFNYQYIGNRYINMNGIGPADIDDAFRVLQEHFDINWLNDKSDNRIQRLWKEPYHLATVELYSLGDAVKRLLESTFLIVPLTDAGNHIVNRKLFMKNILLVSTTLP
jgi:hypothetical protein